MKTRALSFILIFLFISKLNAQLLTFDFAGISGDEVSLSSNSNDGNISPSTIMRGSGLRADPNADRFNSNGWSTTSEIDETKYLEFTLSPKDDKRSFTISAITLKHQRSGTGPVAFAVRYSVDTYATNLAVFTVADVTTNLNNTLDLSAVSALNNRNTPVTFRIYGYNAEGTSGSWGPGDASGNDIVVNGASGTLPVTLTSFSCKPSGDSMVLTWVTAGEINRRYFEIFRSSDGVNFSSVGRVMAAGNSSTANRYTFTDIGVKGKAYYYLAEVDQDGKVEKSEVIQADIKARSSIELLTADDRSVSFNLYSATSKEGDFSIWDLNGNKLLEEQHLKPNLAGQRLIFPLQLQKGIYVARFRNQEESVTQKFVR